MKVVQFDRFGGPDVLEFRDIETPAPKPGEIRVRATAIAVNFTDISLREGLYPVSLPSGIGIDAVGVIDALGEGVEGWRLGERAAYSAGPAGAYAEARCVTADRLLRAPEDIPDDVIAGILMKGLTAQYLLRETFPVRPGHKVLIHSAAGGVGSIATQWANGLGAIVIGAVGSDDKLQTARDGGCTKVVNTRIEGWAAEVRSFLRGEGVNVVYDCVGRDTFAGSVDCLAPRGMLVSFGMQSGPPPAVDLAATRGRGSLAFVATSGAHYATSREALERAFADIVEAVRSGKVKIKVHHRFRLDQAREAHAALQSRVTTGPIILIP